MKNLNMCEFRYDANNKCVLDIGHEGGHIMKLCDWVTPNGTCVRPMGHEGSHHHYDHMSPQCREFRVSDGTTMYCQKPLRHDHLHIDLNGWMWGNIPLVTDNPFHQKIIQLSAELGPFLVEKNLAYGDSARRVSRMLEVFFPDGIPAKRIEDAYYMIQILNKLGRVAEDNDPMGEDPWLDACGYAMLAHCSKEVKKK